MEFKNTAVRKEFELHANALNDRYQAKCAQCTNGRMLAGAARSRTCALKKLEAQFKVYDEAHDLPDYISIAIYDYRCDHGEVGAHVYLRLEYKDGYRVDREARAGGWGYDKEADALAHLLNNSPIFARKLIELKHGQDQTVPSDLKLARGNARLPYFYAGGVNGILEALKYLGYELDADYKNNSYFLYKE